MEPVPCVNLARCGLLCGVLTTLYGCGLQIAGAIQAVPAKLAGTVKEIPQKSARAIKLAFAPDQ